MAQVFAPLFPYVLTAILAGMLLRLSWIDAKTLRLPDSHTFPLIVMGLGLALLFPEPTFQARMIGATAGFLSLGLVGEIYFRRTGAEGLGLGDAKLFAAAGAWLGWQALPIVLLIASVTGLVFVATRRRKDRTPAVPFGPMLAGGLFLCWVGQMFATANWPFRHL